MYVSSPAVASSGDQTSPGDCQASPTTDSLMAGDPHDNKGPHQGSKVAGATRHSSRGLCFCGKNGYTVLISHNCQVCPQAVDGVLAFCSHTITVHRLLHPHVPSLLGQPLFCSPPAYLNVLRVHILSEVVCFVLSVSGLFHSV